MEQHRYGLLLLSILLSIAVQGIVEPGRVQQVVVTGLAAASVTLAVRAARLTPRLRRISDALALLVLAISVVRALGGDIGEGAALAMNAALVALGPPAIAVGVMRDLREQRQVRIQSVMGVLAFYMLIGQIYLVTIVSLIVSNLRPARPQA